jgi:mannose-6-phosphate isomerase-like protein (cupin superfamily)
MKVIRLGEGRVMKDDSGTLAKAMYSAPEAMIVHIEVQPGGFVAQHPTPVDMEFFVLEGEGLFSLGEESVVAGPGCLIPSPRGIPHGMRNPGPGPLRVLAIKNPRPAGEA